MVDTYIPSARIQRLRARAMQNDPSTRAYQGWRGLLFGEGYIAAQGQPLVVRRARGLAQVIEGVPAEVLSDELLVGHHYLGDEALDFPEFRPWSEALEERLAEAGLSPKQIAHYRALAAQISASRGNVSSVEPLPEFIQDEQRRRIIEIWGTFLNHSIRGYEKVLRLGFEGLCDEIEGRLHALPLSDPQAARKHAFWQAVQTIAQAGTRLGRRYAEAAQRELATCDDPARRDELEAIRDVCLQVPARPARTLREAVQALWFAHIITCWEDGINANGIGRIDQLLYPYYAADLAAGRTTQSEAMDLLAAFWCKLYRSYDVQQMMVGGQQPDGCDASNEMSLMVLEVTRALEFVRCLSVRLHKNSPRPLVEKAVELVARGGGIPFFFNDDTLVPGLIANGIAPEDARGYAAIGCIEITIPGKAMPHACSHWLNLAKCLELALYDGVDPQDGTQVGPHTGKLAEMHSIEDVWRAYTRQVAYFAEHNVYGSNRAELEHESAFPLPYLSLLTDDCVAHGSDITWGGARYTYHSSAAVGIPNVADSLEALERLYFQERLASADELLRALEGNFQGYEDLRQALLHRAPKYGNDVPSVDGWAARVAQHYCETMGTFRTLRGGRFLVHLFSYTLMLRMGAALGATPDGRLAGTPLAYSVSAVQGRDAHGLTAMLMSLSRLPHHLAAASSSAIIEADPAFLEGEGRAKFVDLIQTAIRQGVGQMQWNVVSAETLRRAQAKPEAYRNLCVRVSGFSQQFILLDKEMQEHIIARTKHRG
jgi:pyruvate formate-lyase/glycerol dehydratase family glycyl radical enzyme